MPGDSEDYGVSGGYNGAGTPTSPVEKTINTAVMPSGLSAANQDAFSIGNPYAIGNQTYFSDVKYNQGAINNGQNGMDATHDPGTYTVSKYDHMDTDKWNALQEAKSKEFNPVGMFATAASIAFPAFAPLIMAASSAANGGSLEDIVKSAALSYGGGLVSSGIGSTLAGQGMSSGMANAIGGAASGALKAGLSGGDIGQSLLNSAIGAGVGGLASQIPGYSDMPSWLQSAAKGAVTSGLSGALGSNSGGTSAPSGSGGASGYGSYLNTPAASTSGNPISPLSATDAAQHFLPGGVLTAGNKEKPAAAVVGDSPTDKQLYSELAPADVAPTNQYFMPNNYSNQQPTYMADGGLAQSSQTTDSTAPKPFDLMAELKALSEAPTGLKPAAGGLRVVRMDPQAPSDENSIVPQLIEALRSRGIELKSGGQPNRDHEHPNYDGTPVFRTGGLEGMGGKYVEGAGDGTSDDISAMLANGEFVFSADVVAALGNGSNKAGAEKLQEMVEGIRKRSRSAEPDKLSPDAKSPLEYLKSSKGNKRG